MSDQKAEIEKELNATQDWLKRLKEIPEGNNTPLPIGIAAKAFFQAVERAEICLKFIQQQEKEIQTLKKRLDVLENPRPTRLDKGTNRPSH